MTQVGERGESKVVVAEGAGENGLSHPDCEGEKQKRRKRLARKNHWSKKGRAFLKEDGPPVRMVKWGRRVKSSSGGGTVSSRKEKDSEGLRKDRKEIY